MTDTGGPQAATDTVLRVIATPAALKLIAELQAEFGPVLFHQPGECCDGSSPLCYPQGDEAVGDDDVRLGEIGGVPFYMSPGQFDFWQHTQQTLDVVPGRSGSFSLANGHGVRFITRSRVFSEDEAERLAPIGYGPDA